jgi:hypothetical protein
VFRVLPQLQYSASRELEKTSLLCEGANALGAPAPVASPAVDETADAGGISKSNSSRRRPDVIGGLETEGEVQARLETLRAAAAKEQTNNELTKQLLAGTPVTYGSTVQLLHVQVQKYSNMHFLLIACTLSSV